MDYQYYDDHDYMDDDDDAAGNEDMSYNDPIVGNGNHHHPGYDYADNSEYMTSIGQRLWDSYEHCMLPSLLQVSRYLLPLVLGCWLCRLLSALYERQQRTDSGSCASSSINSWQAANAITNVPLHLIQAACGFCVLYGALGERMLVLLLLSSISYALLQLVIRLAGADKDQRGAVALAVLCIGSQFLYELAIWRERSDWPQLRGLQMVVNMKVISLGFDLTAPSATGSAPAALRMPGIAAYLGYIFNPATCVLGPWISYSRYLDAVCRKPQWRRGFCQMLCNVLLCLLSLTVSNCVAPALGELHLQQQDHDADDEADALHNGGLSHWLLMYTGALSVRTSHYFVCFLSQALLASAGQQLDAVHPKRNYLLGELVAKPWHIEWPRSLSALVRCWNIPMHEWLKRYVYTASKQRSRRHTILAVFCTYVVSSLLHGMDFRIYLVLLSLATFAEGETMLRRHLARLANACVAANPCRGADSCRYLHCPQQRGWEYWSTWLVWFTNLGFTLLAIGHLAYLGVVLLNETLTMEVEDNELPFMYHWAAAGFLSHYVGIGMFVLYLFIS